MSITVSLAQMHIVPGNVEANLTTALGMIEAAAAAHSQMILFPELWTSGYDLTHLARHAIANQEILIELQRLASLHNLWIGGSMITSAGQGFHNTFNLCAPDGRSVISYDKVHLFRLMDEHTWLKPGEQLSLAQLPWGLAGMAICYDLRFPEMFRRYALGGATHYLLPAQWPTARAEHWNLLARARAVENQAFMLAVNTVGRVGSESFAGCSAVYSPWGEATSLASDAHEELLTVSIDLAQVKEVRSTIPVLSDRNQSLDQLSAWGDD